MNSSEVVETAPFVPVSSEFLSADTFKSLFRGHPGGVAVITAHSDTGPVAFTATSVASVSADPALLIFSVSSLSSSARALATASTVVVHLLDADDLPLAQLGATSGVDRFANPDTWTLLQTGEPVYTGVRAWVRCAIMSRMDAGGSTVFAAQALQASLNRQPAPGEAGGALVHHNRTWYRIPADAKIG